MYNLVVLCSYSGSGSLPEPAEWQEYGPEMRKRTRPTTTLWMYHGRGTALGGRGGGGTVRLSRWKSWTLRSLPFSNRAPFSPLTGVLAGVSKQSTAPRQRLEEVIALQKS
jgi:hypothetical protein